MHPARSSERNRHDAGPLPAGRAIGTPGSAEVVFVAMPYAAVERPSLALATLSAALAAEGLVARTIHANLRFAERVGPNHYDVINGSEITTQLGEWTFAQAAFGDGGRPTSEFIGYLASLGYPQEGLGDWLDAMRRVATRFVADLANEIVALAPRIVGCSSVFQQHCASLALLRAIAERDGTILTMLGGANCEGAMGLATHRNYPWVDVVVSGEADRLLPGLCRDLLEHGREVAASALPYGVIGPAHRGAAIARATDAAPRVLVEAMDELPVPDFDDYFDQLAASPLRRNIKPCLVVETSRGCWWGAKHHCTFCGLNGAGMAFRAKSETRVETELLALSQRYGLKRFMTVDNILDHRYFRNVLPMLAARGDMLFFYETKANLTRRQLATLSDAGVRWIQPGIEALSDPLLKLLDKGCSVAVNVQLLKWAYEYGIWVIWNHLYGAPGDAPGWYEDTADWVPLIAHLQPPPTGNMVKVRYDRFSPYFDRAARYGLDLEPYESYALTYPVADADLADQAYFFVDRHPQPAPPVRLMRAIRTWADGFYGTSAASDGLPERRADAPVLSMTDDGDRIVVRDTRPCAVAAEHRLEGIAAAVCRACDGARDEAAVLETLRAQGHPAQASKTALLALVEARIVARFGTLFLCLATDAAARPYVPFKDFAGGLFYRVQDRPAGPDADPWSTPVTELFAS